MCLDKSVRGQTEFILPNLPSPLSTSHVHRAFRFLEGTVTFLPRPEAPSKAKDSAASLASRQVPSCPELPEHLLSIRSPHVLLWRGPEVG